MFGGRSTGDGNVGPAEADLFRDIHALRDANVHEELAQEAEEEHSKYKDTFVGRIAKSDAFERITMFVIMLNAIAIGIDANYTATQGKPDNLYEGPAYFIITELFFMVYFTGEIIIRFIAYKVKHHVFCDAWFIFDSVLVLFMVMETVFLPMLGAGGPLGQLSVLRLLRLLRITRVAKLMRMFPELMMIIKGITAATKAVIWTAILLVIITYTWAILFTNEFHQGKMTDEEARDLDGAEHLFGSMGKSMRNLLIMGTILDDVTYCTDTIRATGSMTMLVFFIFYILLNSFTMMNMLVGILVEVVGSTAEGERARIAEEQVKESINVIFHKMDRDGSGLISREEFEQMRKNKQVQKSLQRMDIKGKQFDMFVELLFEADEDGNERSLGKDKLLNMILRLRPGTPVSALDFAALKQLVHSSHVKMRSRVNQIEKMLDVLNTQPRYPNGAGDEIINGNSDTHGSLAAGGHAAISNGIEPELKVLCGEPKQRITVHMLSELEKTSSQEIIAELQRRLGMSNLEETGVPLSMMDEELQERVRQAEAFQIPGAPQPDDAWTNMRNN